ncbi:MAG: hypothetical protein HYW65_01260 [Candidatus Liptonbacteria bacterium]|nr:hypothetical protein [Candidatus Liptonbacteria bacterium]
MIRWAVIGALFAGAIGAFAWWRSSTLEDLPPPAAPAEAPTAIAIPPVEVNRDEILKFEEAQLRQKAAEAGVEFTTSTPEAVVASPSAGGESAPEAAASSTVAEEAPAPAAATSSAPASAVEAHSSIATSTAAAATSASSGTASSSSTASSTMTNAAASTTTAPTSTPPRSPAAASSSATSTPSSAYNPRQFQIDGAGFCGYNTGVSSVILSGYPLVMDVAVSGSWIKTWTATQVVFVVSSDVPAGTYKATVRGVNESGYCTASASSPPMVTVP